MKATLWSLVFALAFPLVLFAVYFVNGSLESFPTSEQHEKARIGAGLNFMFFAALEAIVLFFLLRKKRI